jgi:hypothetical protein
MKFISSFKNNGICIISSGQPTCTCSISFTGSRCEFLAGNFKKSTSNWNQNFDLTFHFYKNSDLKGIKEVMKF